MYCLHALPSPVFFVAVGKKWHAAPLKHNEFNQQIEIHMAWMGQSPRAPLDFGPLGMSLWTGFSLHRFSSLTLMFYSKSSPGLVCPFRLVLVWHCSLSRIPAGSLVSNRDGTLPNQREGQRGKWPVIGMKVLWIYFWQWGPRAVSNCYSI